jgi:protein CpxP
MSASGSRSLWKEIAAGAVLAGLVFALAFGAPSALASLFGRRGLHEHDPERLQKRAAFATELVLREVEATPEQTAQVQAIVASAIAELAGVREQHEARRDALLAELVQPEISRTSLQALRAEEIALWDATSARLVDALVDAAAVLTPEQRERLLELARELHEHRH